MRRKQYHSNETEGNDHHAEREAEIVIRRQHATRWSKVHNFARNHCTLLRIIYITCSAAVAFCGRTVLLFVLADKVTPRVADGRSGTAGEGRGCGGLVRREGREGKGAVSSSQKCFWGVGGSEVGEASAVA